MLIKVSMSIRKYSLLTMILFFVFIGCQSEADEVCIRSTCVDIEIVQTPEKIEKGLMFRDNMPQNHGMLFVFASEGEYSFWMKNTLIPLDMIWMDYNRRVVHIEENVPPCKKNPCPSYTPSNAALYVLEVNAGYVQKHSIKLNDRAEFKINQK